MARLVMFLLIVTVVAMYSRETSAQVEDDRCQSNEVWNNCGTACPATCDDPRTVKPCTKQCRIGCECKSGYIRLDEDTCVEPEDC